MRTLARIILLSATLAACSACAPGAVAEYELKAAYLFSALRFIEWPPVEGEQHITIGVVGPSPMEGYLRALQSSSIRGRNLRVLTPSPENIAGCCRVLFFGKYSRPHLARLLAKAETTGVLTVGDDPEFIRAGGMMALIAEGRQLTIQINAVLARRHGLTISSQLLEIARLIDGSDLH